jgi:hypothetical protein
VTHHHQFKEFPSCYLLLQVVGGVLKPTASSVACKLYYQGQEYFEHLFWGQCL